MPGEALEYLGCKPGGIYVDGTVGGGGHALEILKKSSPGGTLIGLDRDAEAIEAAKETLKGFKERTVLVKENFRNIPSVLAVLGIREVDGILLDLGVSSYQLERPERGFSFRMEARLDMRMDTWDETTAYGLVNGLEAKELEKIFREYGEERFSRGIARAIVEARKRGPVETTTELAGIILGAIPRRFHGGNIHPATRVFQALRIAVNDELGSLEDGLKGGMDSLKEGGRMAVISFHSLEDRIVKETFRDSSSPCVCPPRLPRCACGRVATVRLLTKRPVTPSDEEIERNPRARSAKLRAVERI